MKKITFTSFLLLNIFAFGQKYIDFTKELSDIKGNLSIDGNTLKKRYNTQEEIIITGKNMKIHDKSGFVFNNVIVQLSGDIVIEDDSRIVPRILDSYILCRSSDNLESDRIITRVDNKYVIVSETKYFKKMKGNPEVWIFKSANGKSVFKGKKNNILKTNFSIPKSRYDIKIVGGKFFEEVLLY